MRGRALRPARATLLRDRAERLGRDPFKTGIGYVTPEDERTGRGPAIRRARIAGMHRAQSERIKHNRRSRG